MADGYATHGTAQQAVKDIGKTGAFALVFSCYLMVGDGVGGG